MCIPKILNIKKLCKLCCNKHFPNNLFTIPSKFLTNMFAFFFSLLSLYLIYLYLSIHIYIYRIFVSWFQLKGYQTGPKTSTLEFNMLLTLLRRGNILRVGTILSSSRDGGKEPVQLIPCESLLSSDQYSSCFSFGTALYFSFSSFVL